MSDLDAVLAKLVAAERGEAPEPLAAARVWSTLAPAAATPAAKPTARTVLKLIVSVVLAGIVGAALWVGSDDAAAGSNALAVAPDVAQAVAVAAAVEPAAAPPETDGPADAAAALGGAAPDEKPASDRASEPAPGAAPRKKSARRAKRKRPAPHKAPASERPPGEAELIRAADSAVRKGAYARAREQLAQHRKRFSDGALAEDRRALGAIVACKVGRGNDLAQRFYKQHSGSVHRERVEHACVD